MNSTKFLNDIYDLPVIDNKQAESSTQINLQNSNFDLIMWIIIGVVLLFIIITIACIIIVKKAGDNNTSKSHGCLITIIIFLLIIGIAIGVTIFIKNQHNPENTDNTGLLSRKATLNDITVSGDELDLSSFGEKLTFTPKADIDGLKLKFVFQKSNGTELQIIEKSIGNVKEGQQYSITISIAELSWDVIKNIFNVECKYTISAGTISYFA